MRNHLLSAALLGLITIAAAILASPIGASTIHVPADYPTIQAAINSSSSGDTILVGPGTYYESLDYHGRDIVVQSTNGPLETTITNDPDQTLVLFDEGETVAAVLEGFRLEGGWIGIRFENSAATIRHNILSNQNVNNWAAISLSGPGYPIYATPGPCPAVIENNTILGSANGGLSTFSSVAPTIKNNIFAFNSHYGMHKEGIQTPVAYPNLSYNCVYGNPISYYELPDHGIGSFELDPMLNGNQTLQEGSPCIDAGDPDPAHNDPDGTRNDIGAVPLGALVVEDVAIEPDTLLAVEAQAVDPDPVVIYLGGFDEGYEASEVDEATFVVNDSLLPLTMGVLASHPDWPGPVWRIEIDRPDFILSYPLWWDASQRLFSLAGAYNDGQPFVFSGSFAALGHVAGDLTSDGSLDISDLIRMVEYQFMGGPAPHPALVADLNGDCSVADVSDLVHLVNYMFHFGAAPRPCIDQPLSPAGP